MPDNQTSPEWSVERALVAFRADPNNSKLFAQLHKELRERGPASALGEVLELWAEHGADGALAAAHWAEAAEARLHAGEVGAAEADFRRALDGDPANGRAATAFADHLMGARRYAEAAAVIEGELAELERRAEAGDLPARGKKAQAITERRADRHAALARLWDERLGRVDRSLHHWQRAWKLSPQRTDALEAARAIYASLGDDAMVVRLLEAELEVLGQRAAQRSNRPHLAGLHLAVGRLRVKLGERERAAASLEEALRLEPTSSHIREALADLYASPAFADDTQRRQRAASLFVDLGREATQKDDVDDAVRYLRRGLGVDPYSRSAANDLERVLSRNERWDELDRLYQHLAGTVHDDAERAKLLDRRCQLYRDRLGDRAALKATLAELIELPGAGPEYSVELRELYREDEDWALLAELIQREAQRVDPSSTEFVREMLELATIEREYLRARDRAAERIHAILQHNPRQEEALARYADHFRERRDWRGLADLNEFAIEKLIETGASSQELLRRLEELALLYEQRMGEMPRAIAVWQRVVEIDPHSPKAAEAIRRLSSREKTWQSLIGVLEQEAESASSPQARADALRRIAQTYRERHFNPRRAIALYEEVLGMFPDDAASLQSLVELYDREGDEAGLAFALRRQLELDARMLEREHPGEREWPVARRVERLNRLRRLASMYEERLADVDGVVYACSGILELLPGDRDALGRMERVLERAGDLPRLEQTLHYHAASASGPAERAKVLRRLARLAGDRDDEVAAMERWENVLQAVPSDKDALAALSKLYERHQRWGELADVLERQVLAPRQVLPGTPEAAALVQELRRYAQVVDGRLGEPARAMRAWERLLELAPRDRSALEALERLYQSAGQWHELVQILDRQVPLYQEDEKDKAAAAVLKRAALLEDRLGAPADASAALERLLADIDPSNLAGHKALRRLYESRGDFESAVRVAEREIYLSDEPKQRVARGLEIGFLCRDRLGEPTRALQAFERVLELDSEHGEALEAAGELYAAVGNWTRHVELLESQLERARAGRERRGLMLRIAQVTAERLGRHKDAFEWYRRAHRDAPDAATLAELRRAAEAYGLWRELIDVYEAERDALRDDDGTIRDADAYVGFSREIAGIAEARLRDPQRAVAAIRDALGVKPRSEALIAEVERIARNSDSSDIWRAYLECVEVPMAGMARSAKVSTLVHRARIFEEQLADPEAAARELLRAFAWQPDREDVMQALCGLSERTGRWNEVIAAEAARCERSPSREQRLAALRRKAEIIEERLNDRVRAFRVHLSAFLLAPEDQETLAHLWRLARDIGTYTGKEGTPVAEPPAASVEPPEAVRDVRPNVSRAAGVQPPGMPPARTTRQRPAVADPTMELSIRDLVVARLPPASAADDEHDTLSEADRAEPTIAEPTFAEIPPPGPGDRTQPIDLADLLVSESAKPHAADPTMQLRTDDLIEALGGRRAPEPPSLAQRPRRPSKAPPPPPPSPVIRRMPPPAPAPRAPTPAPALHAVRMPARRYESPWDELSTAYELLPTSSPAMKLRWLFRSAEVQETGAGNHERAFEILARALDVAPDPSEAKGRLYRLAQDHDAWNRLADLYQRAADDAGSSEVAASYLLEVADIRIRQNRPLETEGLYRRVLGMRPDDDDARSRLEQLYRQEQRWVDLAASLEERTDPRLGSAAPEVERPGLLRELAAVYEERLARPHDAIDALERLRQLVPEDTSVLSALADLHTGLGRWSKVIECLQRLADVDESGTQAREAWRRIASIYENELELAERAIEAHNHIIAQWPDDTDAYEALDRLYQSHGRWQELADVLRRRAALARDPESRAHLLARRADILLDWLDAPDEAAAALRHARTIRDDDALADKLVQALVRAGREREAAAVLEGRVMALRDRGGPNPGSLAALLIRLGTLRHRVLGDREGARVALDEALSLVPDHPTAIAAKAELARDDRDPQLYAQALLKRAEVEEDHDAKVDALLEAGRVLRDECRDHDGARAAFQRVLELRPYHADATWAMAGLVEQGGDLDSASRLLLGRLEDAELTALERAEIFTQLAALARQAGLDPVAEHRLDEALAEVATHTPAIIAKADLLFELERYEILETFLNDVLPALEDAEPAIRAALRRRLAAVCDRLGRVDEAYQGLLEADRLHRGDVLIKLQLGENRYRARRWREAALHLSALAEHSDAERYPAEVAEGLYHAALAEIRSLRPEKAGPLYERAIELKPNYAPALHALAELAMERGDSKRAADLLTRQASATTDPDERLRMFEALGDMAMMTLGDPDRARTCYDAAVAAATPLEARHVPLLKKLLELQDLAYDARGSARTAELLASFADTPAERAARLTLAAESYHAAGDRERARAAAERALEVAPYDLMAANVASEIARAEGNHDRVAAILSRALGGKVERDELEAAREAMLWTRLGEARLARKDRKGAMAAFESAVAKASDSDGAMQARRQLLELWKDSDDTRSRLVEYHRTLATDTRDIKDVVAYGRALAQTEQYDGGRALFDLGRALGFELSESDLEFLRGAPVRVMAPDEAYDAALDESLHTALMGETDVALMSRIMSTLWESVSLLFPGADVALAERGLADARRTTSSESLPAVAIFTRVANALRVPATLLYAAPGEAPDITVVCASPPVVVLGPRLLLRGQDAPDALEMRYLLGRAAEMARPENVIAAGQSEEDFVELVATVEAAFGSGSGGAQDTAAARKLRSTLPVRARQPLVELIDRATGADLDPQTYIEAVHRKADRAGYLVSGDAETTVRLATERRPREGLRHLIELALRPEFVAARAALGVGVLR